MTQPDSLTIEGHIIDLEGDVLLLDLALEEVLRTGNDSNEPSLGDGYRVLRLTGDQVRCLTHAASLVGRSVNELSRCFYGPGEAK